MVCGILCGHAAGENTETPQGLYFVRFEFGAGATNIVMQCLLSVVVVMVEAYLASQRRTQTVMAEAWTQTARAHDDEASTHEAEDEAAATRPPAPDVWVSTGGATFHFDPRGQIVQSLERDNRISRRRPCLRCRPRAA